MMKEIELLHPFPSEGAGGESGVQDNSSQGTLGIREFNLFTISLCTQCVTTNGV